MIKGITITENVDDLYELTGIPRDTDGSHSNLIKENFNTDDVDFIVVSPKKLTVTEHSEYEMQEEWEDPVEDAGWLINRMDAWCEGYDYLQYNGKWFYLVHHA